MKQKLGETLMMYRGRAKRRITQQQLAAEVGVSDKTMRNWENSVSYPTAENLKRVIEVYLKCELFTAGKEYKEAKELWLIRSEDGNFDLFPPFDAEWFANLEKPTNGRNDHEKPSQPVTETLTFLFTDIEGSTRLWEQYRDGMEATLSRHDAILRRSIAQYNGQVFKEVGDAFYAVFQSAPDAVNAAIAIQNAICNEKWKEVGKLAVRTALHTGSVYKRNNDYFGATVNRVARLVAAAHGGQIILSNISAEVVRDYLPKGVNLRDLGEHKLRDFSQPDRIFQVIAPNLPDQFPLLKTMKLQAHNLPNQLTSFIGRKLDIVRVKGLLGSARLVTLTGVGGAGKTRLAIQVAGMMLDNFEDGVWLVELAAISDPQLVVQAAAMVFGIRETTLRDLETALIEYLRYRKVLLVLDNCEHLSEACTDLIGKLLHACANIHILTTSRAALGITGETTWRVPPLSLPEAEFLSSPTKRAELITHIIEYDAAKLFVERATAVQSRFLVTPQNVEALIQICRWLDGIPLAIELAAARVKVLTVEQIAARLHDRFNFLTNGSSIAMERHRTLRALIDWGYELLSEKERALLRRLAVFAGGWTLAAVESVCAGDGLERNELLDLLTSLVNKSLVAVEEQENQALEPRYSMLETIRQYAQEKLTGEAYVLPILQERHANFFLAFIEKAEPHFNDAKQTIWLKRVDLEHSNIRAALEWSLEPDKAAPEHAVTGVRLAGALWWFWDKCGYPTEGCRWSLAAMAVADEMPPTLQANVTIGASFLILRQGYYDRSIELAQKSLALYQQAANVPGEAWATCVIGLAEMQQSDFINAYMHYNAGLELYRQINDKWGIGTGLFHLGLIAAGMGDFNNGIPYLEESLTLMREVGDTRRIAMILLYLGGILAFSRVDPDGGVKMLKEGLVFQRELGDTFMVLHNLEGLAWARVVLGQYEQAINLFGAAEGLREAFGAPLPPFSIAYRDTCLAIVKEHLDLETLTSIWNKAKFASLNHAISFALEEVSQLV